MRQLTQIDGKPARKIAAMRRAAPITLPRRQTASALIYGDLKQDIISLTRKPGDVLAEKDIAARYGVSRTPVREAMLRLAEDGLVETFPQSGTFVTRIPVDELEEAILVRVALEGVTARLAAERRSATQLAALAATIEQQRRAVAANDRNAFHDGDEAFHAAIATAAGHAGIWTLVQGVKFQVDRYRRLTLPAPGRMLTVIKQHEAVYEAVAAQNPAMAVAQMSAHLAALQSFSDLTHIDPAFLVRKSAAGAISP